MATYKYGGKITRTYSGSTRTWRSFVAYTISTSASKVSYTISVGVENTSNASMSFDAKKLNTYLYVDGSQKKQTVNSSKLSLNGDSKKTIISSYSGSFTRGESASTHTLKGYSTASSSCAWHGTSTVSVSVSVPAVGEPDVTTDIYRLSTNLISLDTMVVPTTTAITASFSVVDDVEIKQILEYDEDGEPSVFGSTVTLSDYDFDGTNTRYQFTKNIQTGKIISRKIISSDGIDEPFTNISLPATTSEQTDATTLVEKVTYLELYLRFDESELPDNDLIDYLVTTTIHYNSSLTKTESAILPAKYEQRWSMDFVASGASYPDIDESGYIKEASVLAYPWDSDNEQFSNDPDPLDGKFLLNKMGDDGATPPQYTWSIPITLGKEYVDDPLSLTPNAKVKVEWQNVSYSTPEGDRAFYHTKKNMNYANGLANAVFVGSCDVTNYSSRVWYSQVNNPLYFPDTNYIEVGSNDTSVYGLTKVGDYLCIVKQGKTTDTSIYLAYPTSFEDDTTYAVKQGLSGVGADSRYSFNIMNEEALFLSNIGIMAIVPSEDDEKRIQNRSYFIDKKLAEEDHAEAYSFVFGNMYYLAFPNGHCYVLDGNQRNSWGNDRTNLVYECYYLENVSASNFVKFNDSLWFSTNNNLCRFKTDTDAEPYKDGNGGENDETVAAEWSTVFDDDGSVHYYKTMQKKGNVVSILPTDYKYVPVEVTLEEFNADREKYFELIGGSYERCDDDSIFNGGNYYIRGQSATRVFVRKDFDEPVEIERTFNESSNIPSEMMLKKKFKKYKRLQFIVRNEEDEPFGVDQIVKNYTVGNYAKK